MKNLIRKTKVAGQFYDKNPVALQSFIDDVKADTNNTGPTNYKIKAVVLPHAGYVFSGKTAIKTLMTAKSYPYKNIFIISPSHYVSFEGAAISTYTEYETPLGNVTVDCKTVSKLAENGFLFNNNAHKQEHSLEVMLPLVKEMFPDVPIVPIVCGFTNNIQANEIADKLHPYWNEDNLWIISSDFTHYGRNFGYTPFTDNIKKNLNKLDNNAIKEILNLDPVAFYNYVEKTGATICGKFPILIMLYLAKNFSEDINLKIKLIEYITSGDLTGDYSHCVSYAGITVYI